jgi:hypothetical protein
LLGTAGPATDSPNTGSSQVRARVTVFFKTNFISRLGLVVNYLKKKLKN